MFLYITCPKGMNKPRVLGTDIMCHGQSGVDERKECRPVLQCLDIIGENPLLLFHLLVFAE